jgi:thiol-disulfide isomerase/thioredoxin
MDTRTSHLWAVTGLLAALTVLAGCSPDTTASATPASATDGATSQAGPTTPSWFLTPMIDVNTGKAFRVSDFAGNVVLVEMMATWCPSCEAEMSQIQLLHAEYGPNSDLVTISLDVDPNEDSTLLKKFAAQKGFDWIVAMAPPSVRTFLAKNYDVDLLNPPLQPMLIIDREGGVWGLPFHLKSAISLKKTIDPYLAQ